MVVPKRRIVLRGGLTLLALALFVAALFSFGVFRAWFPEITANMTAWRTTSHLAPPPPALADLPVRVLTAPAHRGLAILLSGNAGWWKLDDHLADGLQAAGWDVAGVNSLGLFGFFGSPRDPVQTGRDFGRIIDALAPAGRPVVIMGYSFGADTVAATLGAAGPPLVDRFARVIMLGASLRADFAIGAGLIWPRIDKADADVVNDLMRLPADRLVCVYGVNEPPAETPCKDPGLAGAAVVGLPGSHHFNGNYAPVLEAILQHLPT